MRVKIFITSNFDAETKKTEEEMNAFLKKLDKEGVENIEVVFNNYQVYIFY